MEDVIKLFDNMSRKAQMIEDTMVIIAHKPKLIETISELTEENNEVKKIEVDMKALLANHNELLMKQYKSTTGDFRRCHEKMIYLLQHLQNKEKEEKIEKRALKEINLPGTPKLFERFGATQAFSEFNTPRMLVSDYAKSPFAKKRTQVQLQFSDFEVEISNEDFLKIPAYMKGRATLSELQDFLDNVVIRTFNNKYRTLFQHRASMKPSELNLQTMFKSQASYFAGQKFITVGDIARIIERNVNKKDDKYIQMLRHLQIIREARKNSVCCYIWLK